MSCPYCQQATRFVEYRCKDFVSLVGDVRLSRAYYHCAACGRGSFPWDATLRLSTLTRRQGEVEETPPSAGAKRRGRNREEAGKIGRG